MEATKDDKEEAATCHGVELCAELFCKKSKSLEFLNQCKSPGFPIETYKKTINIHRSESFLGRWTKGKAER